MALYKYLEFELDDALGEPIVTRRILFRLSKTICTVNSHSLYPLQLVQVDDTSAKSITRFIRYTLIYAIDSARSRCYCCRLPLLLELVATDVVAVITLCFVRMAVPSACESPGDCACGFRRDVLSFRQCGADFPRGNRGARRNIAFVSQFGEREENWAGQGSDLFDAVSPQEIMSSAIIGVAAFQI